MSKADPRDRIAQIVGRDDFSTSPLAGGCVAQVVLVEWDSNPQLVAKIDQGNRPRLDLEAYMLRYLASHTRLPVPAVIYADASLLLLEYIRGRNQLTAAAERHAAELMAELHSCSGDSFGFERDTLVGGLDQPNDCSASWLTFFKEQRLEYTAAEAQRSGRLPDRLVERVRRLAADLKRWLSEPPRPALIHGDAWAGNVLADGDRITGFVDPAIYYADPEIELAFMTLFDSFGASFFERYGELRPIAPGFQRERRHLYNLYPLLVHVRLFGGSYVSAVDSTLARFGY